MMSKLYTLQIRLTVVSDILLPGDPLRFTEHLKVKNSSVLVDLLAAKTPLSKTVLKDCMAKGCVWLKRKGKKEQRIRRAKYQLYPGDSISIYYDKAVISLPVPAVQCIYSEKEYSVWYKPTGVLTQGSRYGDHCALFRLAQKEFPKTTFHLLHRLDRDANGLVILAHNKKSAAIFTRMFKQHKIEKRYHAVAWGIVGRIGEQLEERQALGGKSAHTIITVLEHDEEAKQSILDVELVTGRFHQIRKHLAAIGHPLVGDRIYGSKTDKAILQLTAYKLIFQCPVRNSQQIFSLPPDVVI